MKIRIQATDSSLVLILILAVILPISIGLTIWLIRLYDEPGESHVLPDRAAPPVAEPHTAASDSETSSGPGFDGKKMAEDLVQIGRETEAAERQLHELHTVVFFLDCLEMKTGVRYMGSKVSGKPKKGYKHLTPDVLTSSAAIECRAETKVAETQPDFAEVCEAITAKWSHPP
jgi:hypothetical protein